MTFSALGIGKKRNDLIHYWTMRKAITTKNILLAITRGGQSSRLEWSGVLRYAAKKPDWNLLSPPTLPHNFFESINQMLESDSVDGLIATDSTAGKISANLMPRPSMKVVFLDSKPDGTRIPAAIANDSEVAEIAAEFLKKRGFRQFAYVKGNASHFQSNIQHSKARAAAFARRLANAGFETTLLEDDERLPQAIKRLPKPVGVLAYNDITANNVLNACRLTRIDVPGQLGLISVDNDVSICENLRPMLTSIQLDFEMAGYQAAQMLDRLLSGKSVKDYRFGVRTLVERDSTRDLRSSGRIVAAAQQIIREHFREKLTSDDIAEKLHVSTRLLQIRFREIAEHGIHEEIVRRRLDAAEQLLKTTTDQVRSISAACGFPTVEHFYRLFRQRHSQTPQTWRTDLVTETGL